MRPAFVGTFRRFCQALRVPGPAALGGALVLVLGACGGLDERAEELSEPGTPPELGVAAQPIIGGALDEATSGVMGLALDLGSRVAGHCSGTLIAPNLVLTARHCVAFTENTDAQGVVECDTATFRNSFPARMLLASPKPVRPTDPDDGSYVRGREVRTMGDLDKVCGSDIALIILESDVPVAPIAPRIEVAPSDRESFSTVGYGLTSLDDPSSDGTRQRADGSAVRCSGDECVALSGGSIRSSEWASVDAPICSGDSGGPALDEQGRVFGVASRGDPDCQIAVYGDVSSWGAFLVDTALEAAEVGGYVAPDWATQAALEPKAGAVQGGGCSLPSTSTSASGRAAGALGVVLWSGWLLRRARRKPQT
jgi:trypsin